MAIEEVERVPPEFFLRVKIGEALAMMPLAPKPVRAIVSPLLEGLLAYVAATESRLGALEDENAQLRAASAGGR